MAEFFVKADARVGKRKRRRDMHNEVRRMTILDVVLREGSSPSLACSLNLSSCMPDFIH
jgi:hypothetical protein